MTLRIRVLAPVLIVAAIAATSCSSCRRELVVSDPVYREAVTAFHVGLAALETSQDGLALQKLQRVTELVPKEPAAWANLGLLYLRHQELDQASQSLERASALDPNNAAIIRLQGLTESRRGNLDAAIRAWKRAVSLDPNDLRSAFAVAEEVERQGGDVNDAEAEAILASLLSRTGNLAVRVEYARLAAKRGEGAELQQAIAPLAQLAPAWPAEAQEQLQLLQKAAAVDPRSAALQAVFLKNLLMATPGYRQALALVTTPQDVVGEPLERFIALRNPSPAAAPADRALAFNVAPEVNTPAVTIWAGGISLRGEGAPVLATADASGVRMGNRRIGGSAMSSADGHVLAIDYNYDFRTDLVVAGTRGLLIFRQEDSGAFTDVTPTARIPDAVRTAPVAGLWDADVDLDGDLDIIVAPVDGAPVVLRNNSDGTFAVQSPFADVTRVRDVVWADLDGETTPDVALLEETGRVRLYRNMRGGVFSEQALANIPAAVAIAAGSVGEAGTFDLLLLSADGAVSRIVPDTWHVASVTRLPAPPESLSVGTARLIVADLDNNGGADLIVAGPFRSSVLLLEANGQFGPLDAKLALGVRDVADLDGDGRLELIGVDAGHRAVRALSRGAKAYHWQVLRPRAATAHGDQRINSFGLGGAVELRTGLHTQRQLITTPLVHFGLGEATQADVMRITWPNGVLQSDFDQKADAVLLADQRLKGSCPWLFAWNGRAMTFVTDLIWRSPLGLRINAQSTADVVMTEDRVRIPGDALVPRNGAYDLRITAELWETHFFDLVSLLVVDHPAGTEAFVDERFAIPAPSLEAVATGPVQPFLAARDDGGRDVSAVVGARDDRHLDFAGRGDYQGITRQHFVELELPNDAPRTGPLLLVAQGWIHPTDSSVNVAISQGRHDAPRGLSLQVADAKGRFREARSNLGFPAGKDKTILIDLAGVFPPSGPRRLRVSTNLEIFWDRLGWAVGRPDVHLEPRQLMLSSAELRYRGYSVTEQRNPGSPERPRYEIGGTAARWFDLEGFYTRYGDVRELLTGVDDRYVIMNAGDELRLTFPQAPPPVSGMVRDFIVKGDGWVKDGDYNTTFSRTVLPLPAHDTPRYDKAPGRLQDDPVYRRHQQDFLNYHTRFVGPGDARDALRRAAGRRQ